MAKQYRIGEVAARAGLAASAIRYYERVGLLKTAPRSSGQRRYSGEVFFRLAVIDFAKEMGFNLAEIKVLLDGIAKGDRGTQRLRALAAEKLPQAQVTLRKAQLMTELLTAVTQCRCPSLETCMSQASRLGVVRVPLPHPD